MDCIYGIKILSTIKTQNCSIDILIAFRNVIYIRLLKNIIVSVKNCYKCLVFTNLIRFLGAIISTPSFHTPTSIVRLAPSAVFTLVISGTATVLGMIKPTTGVITMWTAIWVLSRVLNVRADFHAFTLYYKAINEIR